MALDAPAPSLGEPGREGARVGPVRPDEFQPRQSANRGRLNEALGTRAVEDVPRVDMREQNQPGRVHQDVALTAEGLLAWIEASLRAA